MIGRPSPIPVASFGGGSGTRPGPAIAYGSTLQPGSLAPIFGQLPTKPSLGTLTYFEKAGTCLLLAIALGYLLVRTLTVGPARAVRDLHALKP